MRFENFKKGIIIGAASIFSVAGAQEAVAQNTSQESPKDKEHPDVVANPANTNRQAYLSTTKEKFATATRQQNFEGGGDEKIETSDPHNTIKLMITNETLNVYDTEQGKNNLIEEINLQRIAPGKIIKITFDSAEPPIDEIAIKSRNYIFKIERENNKPVFMSLKKTPWEQGGWSIRLEDYWDEE